MRSSAFAGLCMREVAAARRAQAGAEGAAWEAREAAELAIRGLDAQLRATQVRGLLSIPTCPGNRLSPKCLRMLYACDCSGRRGK